MNFNTQDNIWTDSPHMGTHRVYPVLLLVDGDVHACNTSTPQLRLTREHYGDHIARFTNQKYAQQTLERCGWLVCQHPTEPNTCIAYTGTKYERNEHDEIVPRIAINLHKAPERPMHALRITIEGPQGSGKTVLASRIVKLLKDAGVEHTFGVEGGETLKRKRSAPAPSMQGEPLARLRHSTVVEIKTLQS